MAENLEELKTEAEDKKDYTDIQTLDQSSGEKRDWKSIAEVRMVLYVVPVAILFVIAAFILNNLTR